MFPSYVSKLIKTVPVLGFAVWRVPFWFVQKMRLENVRKFLKKVSENDTRLKTDWFLNCKVKRFWWGSRKLATRWRSRGVAARSKKNILLRDLSRILNATPIEYKFRGSLKLRNYYVIITSSLRNRMREPIKTHHSIRCAIEATIFSELFSKCEKIKINLWSVRRRSSGGRDSISPSSNVPVHKSAVNWRVSISRS